MLNKVKNAIVKLIRPKNKTSIEEEKIRNPNHSKNGRGMKELHEEIKLESIISFATTTG